MSKLIRFILYSVYLTLTGSGIVYLAAGILGIAPWAGIGMLAAACALGYAISGFVKVRIALMAILAAVAAAAATLLLLPYSGWNVVLMGLNIVCLIIGARHNWLEEDTRLINVRLLTAGLVISVLGYFVAILNGGEAALPQIGYTMYVYSCMTVLLVKRRSIQVNAGTQARRMMRSNQLLAWGFVGVFSLAVFFGPLQKAVGALLRNAIVAFFELFNSEDTSGGYVSSGAEASGEMDLSFLDDDVKEWPAWLQFLSDAFLYTITILAVLGLAVLLVWAMIRAGKELSKYLKNWFATFGSYGNDEYSEESEQMLTAQSMRKQLQEDLTRRVKKIFERPVRWNALTPSQRVRHVYKYLLEREKRISVSAENLTPHQLCERAEKDARFAEIYGRVRYAQEEVTAQEAENWRSYLKG